MRRTSLIFAAALCACTSTTIDEDDAGAGGNGSGGDGPGGSGNACEPLGEELFEGTAPTERGDMAFGFDPDCNRVVMFFGDAAVPVMCGPAASKFLTDGYAYDVNTGLWSSVPVAAGPAPIERARSRGVWDAKRSRLILFGGRYRAGTSGAYTFLNDLWAFDPKTLTWEELSPQNDDPSLTDAPTGRMNMTMHADAEGDRILIHAGGTLTPSFTAFISKNDTWAFDLEQRTWSQVGLGGASPPARLFHMGGFDAQNKRMYVFGGAGDDAFTAATFFDDTWVLDLTNDTWSQVQSAAKPEGRIKGEMLYDEGRARLLLFAGHDDTALGNNNDIWSLDTASNQWAQEKVGDTFNAPAIGFCDFPSNFANVDLASPERRESHLFDVNGGKAVMYGGRTDCGLARDTWELDLPTLTWTQINESLVGMTCYRSGSLSCDEPNAKMCL